MLGMIKFNGVLMFEPILHLLYYLPFLIPLKCPSKFPPFSIACNLFSSLVIPTLACLLLVVRNVHLPFLGHSAIVCPLWLSSQTQPMPPSYCFYSFTPHEMCKPWQGPCESFDILRNLSLVVLSTSCSSVLIPSP